MTIYKFEYMHGDADGYTKHKLEVKSNVKNKLIKFMLDLFKKIKPEWRVNFLEKIDEFQLEDYVLENYPEELQDKDSTWDEAEIKLREERALELFNILKETNKTDGFCEWELKEINEIISKEFKDVDIDNIFNVCWNLVSGDIFAYDITCEDRFAKIVNLEIKDSYLSDILGMLNSLNKSELKKLGEEIKERMEK